MHGNVMYVSMYVCMMRQGTPKLMTATHFGRHVLPTYLPTFVADHASTGNERRILYGKKLTRLEPQRFHAPWPSSSSSSLTSPAIGFRA